MTLKMNLYICPKRQIYMICFVFNRDFKFTKYDRNDIETFQIVTLLFRNNIKEKQINIEKIKCIKRVMKIVIYFYVIFRLHAS